MRIPKDDFKVKIELDKEIRATDILQEIGSIGSGNAATALSNLTQQKISIDVLDLHISPPVKVPDLLGLHDTPTVVIYEQLSGDANCDLLLAFRKDEAEKLLSITMQAMFGSEEVNDEMKATAIEEIGNIVLGAFLSAISNFAEINLLPVPPKHTTDIFDAILDVFLAKLCLQKKDAVLFKTRFKCEQEIAQGNLIIFFSEELQKLLVQKGKEWING
ncbi:chemotaxis protein CheC [Candidatus Bathyarchaeota archaeon]|nr:chemotaxis protein CheC [Candidatus Bathyarchaeota archaeon]